jgi:hypothetical protein
VSHLSIHEGLSVEDIEQFYKLWEMTQNFTLDNDIPDSIRWKFGKDVDYMASSAYKFKSCSTRKKATRIAPNLVTRSALPVRCGYHAAGI